MEKQDINNKKRKRLLIWALIVFILFLIGGLIIFERVLNTSKLVCTAKSSNITIIYNNENIVSYKASGMSYDLEGQQDYAKKIGIKEYIEEFSSEFATNANGKCQKK